MGHWADIGQTLGRHWAEIGQKLGRYWADIGQTLADIGQINIGQTRLCRRSGFLIQDKTFGFSYSR